MQIWPAIVISGVLLAGCGGGSGGPRPPTGPSGPTPVGLSIAPDADMLRIKATETFTATAALSDGSSRVVEATWASDNTGVATVSAGRATGIASGEVTFSAEYQGQRATRRVRVLPDYHGQWSGALNQTACRDEGDWRGVCAELANGTLYFVSMALTQSRDAITGIVDLGEAPAPVQGHIASSGHLRLEGSYTETQDGVTLDLALVDWETVTTDNSQMAGRCAMVFRLTGLQGSVRLDMDLASVTKTSATPVAARLGTHADMRQRRAGAAVRSALERIRRR